MSNIGTGTTIKIEHSSAAADIHIGRSSTGGALITIHPNGEFSLADGLTPTDAAMAIWHALSGLIRYSRFPLRAQVLEFHRAFSHPVAERPTIPANDRVRFRLTLIAEEFFELLEACGIVPELDEGGDVGGLVASVIEHAKPVVDLAKFADACGDLDYVVEGARIEFGIDGAPVASAIHAANMAKLGPDGKPIRRADGKSLKPEGWTPPDIAGELRKQGWVSK
jgi:predicted HAD superfamily Cof-like phosphohydrolase